MKRIQDISVQDKKVLVRVDYNVPLKDGKVKNDERIKASLQTIKFLLDGGAGVVLCSHLGRPDGKVNEEFSLKQVVSSLESLTKKSVQFASDCIGSERDIAVRELKNGEIILLENLRYHSEEEANDSEFSKGLAEGIDIYVNDAFSASHRAHASIVGVTNILPGYAGFQLQTEIDNLSKILVEPERPFVFISGGAKISDKLNILNNLLPKIDVLLIGGGMANTFLCAKGYTIGCSLTEKDYYASSNKIVEKAGENGVAVFLPSDVVVTKKIEEKPSIDEIDIEDVGDKDIIADIGSKTVREFSDVIKDAKTIFWNGPLGITEYQEFANGTTDIAKTVSESSAFSVIGGGDTVAAIDPEVKKGFSFISMAGGASMEFLEGKSLPGIEAIK